MRRVLGLSLFCGALSLGAQEVPTTYNGQNGQGSVIEGDTIPWVFLDEILVVDKPTFTDVEARKRYLLLRRRVMKVYPYAKAAGERLDSLNMRLAKKSRPASAPSTPSSTRIFWSSALKQNSANSPVPKAKFCASWSTEKRTKPFFN